MRHHEETRLDAALKNLDSDVSWNKQRQQQVRRNILVTIEKRNSRKFFGFNHWTKKTIPAMLAALLFIGVSTPILLSEIGDQDPISQGQNNDAYKNSNKLPFHIDNQTEAKIEQIKDSGFDLRLPNYSLGDGIEMVTVVKRKAGNGLHVSVPFYHQGKELFDFAQESINNKNTDRLQTFIQRTKEEADEQMNINGKTAYFINRPTGTKQKKMVYIITEGYVFMIHSYHLTNDQMMKVAESVDLSNLN